MDSEVYGVFRPTAELVTVGGFFLFFRAGLVKPVRTIHTPEKTRRNDLCSCGSGIKFKHCCMGGERLSPESMQQLLDIAYD